MGGNAELINAVYQTHVTYQKPAFPPPDEEEMKRIQAARKAVIDGSNWKEHLGDERYSRVNFDLSVHSNSLCRYYQAYVSFFTKLLLSKSNSINSVLEDYVFSKTPTLFRQRTVQSR